MSRLVIHCSIGRSVWIGEARVTLYRSNNRSKPDEIKLLIEAPTSVRIARDEVRARESMPREETKS